MCQVFIICPNISCHFCHCRSPLQGETSQSVMVMEDDGLPHSQSESDSLSCVGWPGRLVPTLMHPTSQPSASNPQPNSGFHPRNPARKQCTANHTRPSCFSHCFSIQKHTSTFSLPLGQRNTALHDKPNPIKLHL